MQEDELVLNHSVKKEKCASKPFTKKKQKKKQQQQKTTTKKKKKKKHSSRRYTVYECTKMVEKTTKRKT